MAVTTFIPKIWSSRLLYALEKTHVAGNLVNRDYEGNITGAGDTVHIGTIGSISVKDYTKNTDIADPDELGTTDQTLVINQSKYFNFQVDDVDKVQAAGDLVDTAMMRAAYALNDASDSYILGLLASGATAGNTIGSTASPIALTASNIYSNIVALRTILDKNNVPTAMRSICIPPEAYALILQDERFTKNTATAEAVTVNGLVGKIAGFDIYESNNVVVADSKFSITAQVSDACTYAEQVVKTEAYRMEKRFADGVKGLHVYGAKVTRPEEIAKLICTF